MKKYWMMPIALIAAIISFVIVSPAVAADYTIKIGLVANTADEDYDGSMVFKDFVESQSKGQIAVEIYPGAQLCGNMRECIESVQAGIIEMTITTGGGLSNIYPEIQVMDIPYMFRDDRTAECVHDGPYVKELRKDILKKVKNVRLMAISNAGGWRNFATVNKLVRTPADVKGQKIRTIKADIQIEMVKLMGGNPTGIAWPEVYMSLATGVVEGTKNGITDIVNMKFQEHLKYITLDGHAYVAALWWMSDSIFKSYPKNLQKVVLDGFIHLTQVTRAFPKRRQIEAYETFRKADGIVYVPTESEKKMFKEAVEPLKTWYTDKFGTRSLVQLETRIAECEQAIDSSYESEIE